MQRRPLYNQHQQGFTLVELLIVIVITSMLFGLIAVNLGQPQKVATVTTSIDSILTDIKGQQVLAMSGDTGSNTTAQPDGIFFQATQYTLFAGSAYSAVDPNNFVIKLPTGATLATTFPSTQVVFTKGSGEVQSFVNGSNTVTLTNGTVSHVITIDRFGATQVN